MADWRRVASLDDLADGGLLRVELSHWSLVLARTGERVHAAQATCPHEMALLSEGRIEQGRIVCPRHLASFSLADGRVSAGWLVKPMRLYPVRVQGREVEVDVEAVEAAPPGGQRKLWNLGGDA